MRSSDLRHRITLQARSTAQDELGQQVDVWSDIASGDLWAQVRSLSGRELMAAQANHSELTHVITIRYQSRFSDPLAMAAMRAKYGTRILNIQASIDVDERHQVIELMCKEGLNDG